MKSNKKGKNKYYFSYIICIIYSNGLDSLTIPSELAKLSQHAWRAPSRKATKKKMKIISMESPPIFIMGKIKKTF